MKQIVGIVKRVSGECELFTDTEKFIDAVKEGLSHPGASGFVFQVLSTDMATRKAIDDLEYAERGEENPHDLGYYSSTASKHSEKVSEILNTALYEKMFAEQETYRDWLRSQPPEEIITHTYEYTVREDILIALECNSISEQQAAALLQSPSPLNDVFQDFEKLETDHMDTILTCIANRANTLLQLERELGNEVVL